MAIMFAALENSLKIETATIHMDVGHLLTGVEEVYRKPGMCPGRQVHFP